MNKKLVKGCALGIAAVFMLGIGAMAIPKANVQAAPVNTAANIGYADMQQLITSSVDYKNAQQTFAAEMEKAQKEFEQKSAGLNENDKKQLFGQYQQRLANRQQELMAQVKAKVEIAIKDVATAQGITVVLDKAGVFYGGKDLTQDVLQKVSK